MQHEGKEESEERSPPKVRETMPHGDEAWFLTRAYDSTDSTKSVVTGYLPHNLMLGRWPRLLVDVFPMICVNCALGGSLPM